MHPEPFDPQPIVITADPRRHPLAGTWRPGVPTAVVILVGWLCTAGWTAEQVVAVLLVLLAPVAAARDSR